MTPFRLLFSLAALYNICFGLWTGLFPQSFFEIFSLQPPLYPSLWACLGMVVGLYGLVYVYVAWKPENGDILIWIGLLGKILGPLGWIKAVGTGELPPRTFPLILANDLIWWFPFLFYLLRNNPKRPRWITGLAVLFHFLGSLGLLWIREGTTLNPDWAARQQWALQHSSQWTMVWMAWALSAMSYLAFLAIWMRELKGKISMEWSAFFMAIAAVGVAADLGGQTVNIAYLTDPARNLLEFVKGTELFFFLSAAVANGLYCVAGLFFSLVYWRKRIFRDGLGILGLLVWGVGFALTGTALMKSGMGIVITSVAVMILFIPWMALTGWKFRPQFTNPTR